MLQTNTAYAVDITGFLHKLALSLGSQDYWDAIMCFNAIGLYRGLGVTVFANVHGKESRETMAVYTVVAATALASLSIIVCC